MSEARAATFGLRSWWKPGGTRYKKGCQPYTSRMKLSWSKMDTTYCACLRGFLLRGSIGIELKSFRPGCSGFIDCSSLCSFC